MRPISNCNLRESPNVKCGALKRVKQHSREQRRRDPCVIAHVPEAEQGGNARAARRTLAMMGWRRAERAALVKDSREGNRGGTLRGGSEGPWGKATEIWKARLVYRWHQVGTGTVHIICKKKTLSVFWVRGCISHRGTLAPSFQLCDCRRGPWCILAPQLKRAACLVLHDTWVMSLGPVPAACYLFNMTDTQKIE